MPRKPKPVEEDLNDPVERGKAYLLAAFPDIIKDIVKDARTKVRRCPKCGGKKTIEIEVKGIGKSSEECPNCEGSGEVREVGDKQARDFVFKAVQEFNQKQGEDHGFGSIHTALRETQDYLEPPK